MEFIDWIEHVLDNRRVYNKIFRMAIEKTIAIAGIYGIIETWSSSTMSILVLPSC